ncbi:ASCH domain-containing protein [Streptomyces cinnamoneus]|uniref:ASCH domain-containing protein n=1 Tax=Streptomyces cinnamoneus TaxID=53446 RepID=UPI003411450F
MPEHATPTLLSPNSVLANALLRTIDMLRPRVHESRPERIEFVVGTQINGVPHLGTNLVQSAAFLLAQQARSVFRTETTVRFAALDNAPYDIALDPKSGHDYQKTYFHALTEQGVAELIGTYYRPFFDSLAAATDIEYVTETYTQQQAGAGFRAEFLRTLEVAEDLRWWLNPSTGVVHTRIPCPSCGWAEKRAERTQLVRLDDEGALFTSVCQDHGEYESYIDPTDGAYLDLATLYRNVVKERAFTRDATTLHVMLKGGDWAGGCQLVDGALEALGTPGRQMSVRIFTPQVLSDTGGKLSKSLIRAAGGLQCVPGSEPWMLSTIEWPGSTDQFVDSLLWLVRHLLSDPKHFFRSFTAQELGRLMASRPPQIGNTPRVRDMPIYKQYYDLIADGTKTIEVRVAYTSMQKIKEGDRIRFTCRGDGTLTRVKRVARYKSFDEMFEHEAVEAINPKATREEQLKAIRQIFPKEKEALGVLAIEVEKVAS